MKTKSFVPTFHPAAENNPLVRFGYDDADSSVGKAAPDRATEYVGICGTPSKVAKTAFWC